MYSMKEGDPITHKMYLSHRQRALARLVKFQELTKTLTQEASETRIRELWLDTNVETCLNAV